MQNEKKTIEILKKNGIETKKYNFKRPNVRKPGGSSTWNNGCGTIMPQ